MIIYKCDVCDSVTPDDILPGTWAVVQVTGGHGTENVTSMRARHVCEMHNVEEILRAGQVKSET